MIPRRARSAFSRGCPAFCTACGGGGGVCSHTEPCSAETERRWCFTGAGVSPAAGWRGRRRRWPTSRPPAERWPQAPLARLPGRALRAWLPRGHRAGAGHSRHKTAAAHQSSSRIQGKTWRGRRRRRRLPRLVAGGGDVGQPSGPPPLGPATFESPRSSDRRRSTALHGPIRRTHRTLSPALLARSPKHSDRIHGSMSQHSVRRFLWSA